LRSERTRGEKVAPERKIGAGEFLVLSRGCRVQSDLMKKTQGISETIEKRET
jgi:hypothetical protein